MYLNQITGKIIVTFSFELSKICKAVALNDTNIEYVFISATPMSSTCVCLSKVLSKGHLCTNKPFITSYSLIPEHFPSSHKQFWGLGC